MGLRPSAITILQCAASLAAASNDRPCGPIKSLFLLSPAHCLIVRPDCTAQTYHTATVLDPRELLESLLTVGLSSKFFLGGGPYHFFFFFLFFFFYKMKYLLQQHCMTNRSCRHKALLSSSGPDSIEKDSRSAHRADRSRQRHGCPACVGFGLAEGRRPDGQPT